MAEGQSTDDLAALLTAAGEALSAGRWEEARAGFEATLEIEESGAALFGLALALWWMRDPVSSVSLQERAFGMFRREGDNENAFFTAMYLCLGYDMTFGNLSASRGWLAKATRVVEDFGLDALRGWVLLCEAVTLHHEDPVAAEEKARGALEVARETNDADLDVCARSELGAALVEPGMTSEGTALLDEAMAGALGGEVQNLDAVVLASCRTITSCSLAVDIKRATQWIRAATRFNERYGSPHLCTTCRIHYARVLLLSGHWALVEAELRAALSLGSLVEPELYAEALALLGHLRVAQGRAGEAERLIAGYEQHAAVVSVLAAIRALQGAVRGRGMAGTTTPEPPDVEPTRSSRAARTAGGAGARTWQVRRGLGRGRGSFRLGRPPGRSSRFGTEPLLAWPGAGCRGQRIGRPRARAGQDDLRRTRYAL
jgi:tetratricopeptide (TPR) repeat protein